jgi:hypothetical protein
MAAGTVKNYHSRGTGPARAAGMAALRLALPVLALCGMRACGICLESWEEQEESFVMLEFPCGSADSPHQLCRACATEYMQLELTQFLRRPRCFCCNQAWSYTFLNDRVIPFLTSVSAQHPAVEATFEYGADDTRKWRARLAEQSFRMLCRADACLHVCPRANCAGVVHQARVGGVFPAKFLVFLSVSLSLSLSLSLFLFLSSLLSYPESSVPSLHSPLSLCRSPLQETCDTAAESHADLFAHNEAHIASANRPCARIVCPVRECAHTFCAACKEGWHPLVSCAEARQQAECVIRCVCVWFRWPFLCLFCALF